MLSFTQNLTNFQIQIFWEKKTPLPPTLHIKLLNLLSLQPVFWNFKYSIWGCWKQVFYFYNSIFWSTYMGNHPEEELAKFGYRSKKKSRKFKSDAIFWWHALTYCLNMLISHKKNPWNVDHFVAFFPQKSYVWITLEFFPHKVAKIHQRNNHEVCTTFFNIQLIKKIVLNMGIILQSCNYFGYV
jgi:hypothetical protein